MTAALLLVLLLRLLSASGPVSGQYNYCLTPSGCYKDECCFRVVPRTGPICVKSNECQQRGSFEPECCLNSRPAYTEYGIFYGYSLLLDDPYEYRNNGKRYLHIWRGVPYAQPPTRERNRRFRRPLALEKSNEKVDATQLKPACAQPIYERASEQDQDQEEDKWTSWPYEWARRMPPQMTHEQISEDCLYLNIYSATESSFTQYSPGTQPRLPILVVFTSHGHLNGNANRLPGHLLAQVGIVVITVQHRLGPFGYLATVDEDDLAERGAPGLDDESDDRALGNYAMWDQLAALQFIRTNAHHFYGDASKITLLGHGTSAADVTAHLFSPKSGLASPPLFHRAILVDGAGDMEQGLETGFLRGQRRGTRAHYAEELGRKAGCPSANLKRDLLTCLRGKSWQELAQASVQVRIRGWGRVHPWVLYADGALIPAEPEWLWREGKFADLPLMAVLSTEALAFDALASLYNLNNGSLPRPEVDSSGRLDPSTVTSWLNWPIDQGLEQMVRMDSARDPGMALRGLSEAYWQSPNQRPHYSPLQRYTHAYTDRFVGSGLSRTLNRHSTDREAAYTEHKNHTVFMLFPYRSRADPWAGLLGAYSESVLQYMLGMPRFFHSVDRAEAATRRWNTELGLLAPNFRYDLSLDLNISDYMMSFVSNFVIYGNATPSPVRNITWDTYRPENRTYFWLNLTAAYNWSMSNRLEWEMEGWGAGFDLRQDWRLQEYAFWDHIYSRLLDRMPRFNMTEPFYLDLNGYRYAIVTMATLCVFLILIILALAILIHNHRSMLIGSRRK